jgi:hypothetical protein
MKRINIFILVSLSFILFSYGFIVGKFEIFPYQELKLLKKTFALNKIDRLERNGEQRILMFQKFSPNAELAFIGDSITNEGEWSDFFPTLKVVNRGIGGDKTSDILARMDSILSTKPNKAFIMIGINDIHRNISISKVLENYEAIIDLLIDADIEVVVQSTIQCELIICGSEHVQSVNLLNDSLALLSTSKRIKFLNLGELSSIGGLSSEYTYDGVHLNLRGYVVWVDKILPLVNE